MKQPYVVPSTARRDLAIGLAIGLALMALIVCGIMKMASGAVGSTLDGNIVSKHFTPYEETQVSFGKGGVRQKEGDYILEPRGASTWLRWIRRPTRSHRWGGTICFLARGMRGNNDLFSASYAYIISIEQKPIWVFNKVFTRVVNKRCLQKISCAQPSLRTF